MINKKTMIVVGAGASKEVNLPTGAELKQKIADILDIRFERSRGQISGNFDVYEAIQLAIKRDDPNARDTTPHLVAAWKFRDAMDQAISIDKFMDSHRDDSKLEAVPKI